MRAVAERSGVTAAAIYKHFKDKRSLVDHVVGLAFQHFELSLLSAVAAQQVGSFRRIQALGEAYIDFAEDHEEEFKILFTPLAAERRRLGDLPAKGGYRILRQCVVEAIREGTIRSGNPDMIALFLWTRVHGIVMLLLACDFEGELDVAGLTARALFEGTRDLLVGGLEADA